MDERGRRMRPCATFFWRFIGKNLLLPVPSVLSHSVDGVRKCPTIPPQSHLHEPWRRTVIFQQPSEWAALCCCFVQEQLIHYFWRVNRFIAINECISGEAANNCLCRKLQMGQSLHNTKMIQLFMLIKRQTTETIWSLSDCVKHGDFLCLRRRHTTTSAA